jgi:hypothetical protein
MPFVLSKEYGCQTTYVVVTPGFRRHVDSNAVSYDPDRARATRFSTKEEAEGWYMVLSGGSSGTLQIESER